VIALFKYWSAMDTFVTLCKRIAAGYLGIDIESGSLRYRRS
jgi:hypothetical protein